MKLMTLATTSALMIAALGLTAETANATPPGAAAPAQETIGYTIARSGDSIRIHTDAGSLTRHDDQLQIRDREGHVAAQVPLTYRIGDRSYPLGTDIDRTTAMITPHVDPEQRALLAHSIAAPKPVDLPTAMGDATADLTVAAETGAILGAIIGGGGGCIGGALLGLAVTAPLAAFLGAGPLGGCAVGALTMGPIGALAGTIFVGGPALIATAVQFFTVLNQPPAHK